MPRLTGMGHRNRLRRRTRRDRGAAATLVSVLLAGGVLLGMTALVVDVGQLYSEREELQSGADSAALAIALDCALDRAACDDDAAELTAVQYAEDNARDGFADAKVCGNDSRLPSCDDPEFDPRGNLTDCLGERPDDGISYVEVRTTTLKSDGSTLLPATFAQTLVSGHQGTTVGACARVAWGAPGVSLAVTISECEWDHATEDSETGENTHYPPPDASDELLREEFEHAIFLHDAHGNAPCAAAPPGHDGPGGFGWLDGGTNCQVEIKEDLTYKGDPGENVPQPCRAALEDARDSGTPVLIPYYEKVEGQGQLTYTLKGVGAFVVTGYRLPGLNAGSNLYPPNPPAHLCTSQNFCIYGYFTEEVDSGEIGPLPGLGAVVVRTVG